MTIATRNKKERSIPVTLNVTRCATELMIDVEIKRSDNRYAHNDSARCEF